MQKDMPYNRSEPGKDHGWKAGKVTGGDQNYISGQGGRYGEDLLL